MYLILLRPHHDSGYTYTSIFTDSILDVAQAFRDGRGKVKVYRIDSLTEIKQVDIEIVEKSKEIVDD